jgi:hypothetical protein
MAKIADPTGSQIGEAIKADLDATLVWKGVTTDNVATELFYFLKIILQAAVGYLFQVTL